MRVLEMNEMCVVGGGDLEDGGPDLAGMSFTGLTWQDVLDWFSRITIGDDVIRDANGNPVQVITHNTTDNVSLGRGAVGGQITILPNVTGTTPVTPISAPTPAPPAGGGGHGG